MKILHLSTENTWRGGEQQLIYLHEWLIKHGEESVIASRENSPVSSYCKKNDLPYVEMSYTSAYHLPTIKKIKKYVRVNSVDLIHIHTSKGHTLAVLASILGMKCPLILSRRVDFPIKNNWFSKYKYNYKSIERILCVSDTIKEITGKEIKNKSKLLTIHSGVNTSKFDDFLTSDYLRETYNIHKKTFLVGNTSALADHKDYFTFINTAERIIQQRDDIHFFIIGEGPLKEEIKNYIQTKGLQNKITLTGFVNNIQEVVPSLDIFLFTSKTEGLGTSILDAMACGLPIVATQAGGVPEMIKHEQNGLLAPIFDDKLLSEYVLRLVEDPDFASKISQQAKIDVKKFSKAVTAKKTLEVYRSIES